MAKNWARLSLLGTRCWKPLASQGWIRQINSQYNRKTNSDIITVQHDPGLSWVCKSWLIFSNTSVSDLIQWEIAHCIFWAMGWETGKIVMERNLGSRSTGPAISPRHPHVWLPADLCQNVPFPWGLPESSYLELSPPTLTLLFPASVLLFSITPISIPLTVSFTHL